MVPYLVRWDEEYGGRGLSILYVENGAYGPKEGVAKEVEESGIEFPVAWDEGGVTCAAYKVKTYPTSFLLGKDGRVLWKGVPLPAERSEKRVRDALGLGGG
ncbi:MAG TPA: TlpA disulfide reductase family protein [Planctomycetota bacterium]|jgi:hypothetical protein|nr:TlpA disulfide reductase family protein [Planctomycetota bacterium]